MPVEKSAGAIVFYKNPNGKIEYLILEHPKGHFAFPKGLIEEGENPKETAKREVKEEAGIEDFVFLGGFQEIEKFFFKVKYDYQFLRGWKMGERVFKIVTYFLVQVKTKEVKISWEHKGFKWLPYQEALEKLTFKSTREVLKKANQFLSSHFKINFH